VTVRNLSADILILGAGPAGLTAALYAARAGHRTLVLEGRAASRLSLNYKLENYPGLPSIDSGELLAIMKRQAASFGAEIMAGDPLALGLEGDPKYVTTKDALVEARAVILATGKPIPKERLIPGEDRLLGQGVSYCATCDGPLFRGAPVAAFGHSEEALKDLRALLQLGCRVLWVPGKAGGGPDEAVAREFEAQGVDIRRDARIAGILGETRVEKVVVAGAGASEEVPVAAVFIFREVPTGSLFGRAGVALDHKQCVAVDRFQRTNLAGVYAAGDITCGGLQVAAAVGEGCVAAMQAMQSLRR